LRSQLPTDFFPFIIPPVYTDIMTDGIFRIKKRWFDDVEVFRVMLPTESPRDSKRQLRKVTWPIHRLKYRRNHRGIQTKIPVQWRALFTIRIADGLIDGIMSSVNPSTKVNICPLCRPSPLRFLLFLPHISWSFVVTTSVFWFTDGFYQFL
jgi:hypothetical protein